MKTITRTSLNRELNLLDAVGIGIGAVIGAGIFVVTAVAVDIAGPAVLVSLLVAGVAAVCNGLSSAQLAVAYPQAGGTYEYGYQVLSPLAGFTAGWMFLVSKLAAGGVVALGFGAYFHQLFPGVEPRWAAVAALALLTLANLAGIKKAGVLNLVVVSVTLLSLTYFVISGLPKVETTSLIPFAPGGLAGIARATALMFFAFTGYARIATIAEEVKNPTLTIPRAIIITLAVTIVLYLMIMMVAVGNLGAESLGVSSSPLLLAAKHIASPGLVSVIGLAATTSMLGVLLSQMLGISRMLFAMARKNDLPRVFTRLSVKTKVPVVGILFTAGLILLFIFFGTLKQVTATASFAILLYYSIANLAAYQQTAEQRLFPKAIQVIGLAICLLMAVSLQIQVILFSIGVLAVGFGLRWALRRFGQPQNP